VKLFYQQLRDWKNSECVACSSNSICPKTVRNIKLCFEEGPSSSVADFRTALIIRTMRVTCSKQRKKRRSLQGVRGPQTSWTQHSGWTQQPPRTRAASLYCSDKKEFSECLASV
jgi:hypothetical protein